MKTSQTGIDLIKQFEGCRLTAYRCSAGVPTIGYGHTAGVKMGQIITQAQAEAFLRDDLEKFERAVMKYDSKYHWNQNQFDALVSFAFNIGSIDQLTNKGKRSVAEVAQKMLAYSTMKVNGVKVESPGLRKRRETEQALFLKPVQQEIQAASIDASHLQLNYQPGETYTVAVDGLRIRTKAAVQSPLILPNAEIIGIMEKGIFVKNQATARVGDAIWMYVGLDKKGREQWICADTGSKAYVK